MLQHMLVQGCPAVPTASRVDHAVCAAGRGPPGPVTQVALLSLEHRVEQGSPPKALAAFLPVQRSLEVRMPLREKSAE